MHKPVYAARMPQAACPRPTRCVLGSRGSKAGSRQAFEPRNVEKRQSGCSANDISIQKNA